MLTVRSPEKDCCRGIFEGSFWVPKLIEEQPRNPSEENTSSGPEPFEEPSTDSFYNINDRAPEGYEIVSCGAGIPTTLYEVFKDILDHNRNKNYVERIYNISGLDCSYLVQYSDGSLVYYYSVATVLTAYPDGSVEIITGAYYPYIIQTQSRVNALCRFIGYWSLDKKYYDWYFRNVKSPERLIPFKNAAIITPEGWLALPKDR
jgi:hypothetical protein